MTPEQLARFLNQADPRSALDALDNREMEVFSILSQGYTSGQIPSLFGIAPDELKQLKQSIQAKLGLKSEAQLVRAALRHKPF